ncbi:MAG: exonuclease subunit SbcD, partial [Planctomycetota bacterium]
MAFRVLHIADLHLGQRFHDQDRGAEEAHALDQLVALCREQAVDVVLVAGDVFDTANPGAAETARWHRFLARLVLEQGVGTVVVIAGNDRGKTGRVLRV